MPAEQTSLNLMIEVYQIREDLLIVQFMTESEY